MKKFGAVATILVGFFVITLFLPTGLHAQTKLLPRERQAAVETVKILGRLASAVEVGPSLAEYSSRLIDAKAGVEDRIGKILAGEIRQEIALSLTAFIDAHELWRIAVQREDVNIFMIYACSFIKKYNLAADDYAIHAGNCGNVDAVAKIVPYGAKMYNPNWRHRILDPLIIGIWKAAAGHLEKAEEILSR